MRSFAGLVTAAAILLPAAMLLADNVDPNFHNAPASAKAMKNPYQGQASAIATGRQLYARNCLSCHGKSGGGTGNVPSLIDGKLETTAPGEVFWFITKGDKANGMPSWAQLPEQATLADRYLCEVLGAAAYRPPRPAPGRHPDPGGRRSKPRRPPRRSPISATKSRAQLAISPCRIFPRLMQPESADNGPEVVARPDECVAASRPPGFKVELYAAGLDNPRLMRTAPNGDIFLSRKRPWPHSCLPRHHPGWQARANAAFSPRVLNHPYGIAFYPPGPDPQWIYVGNTDEVVRFPYHNGDLKASGPPQHIADLPNRRRPLDPSRSHSRTTARNFFVAVGSGSNVDDPDTHPGEKDRADILSAIPPTAG